MDHAKTASPCFSHKSKATESFMRLPVAVTGMIAHGHVDQAYAHYSLDLYKADSNHTVGSIAKLLRDLELPPVSSTRELFKDTGSTSLFRAVLQGKEVCLDSLPVVPNELTPAKPLPPILNVQLDNCWKDNKSRYVFCFWSLLVAQGVFEEVNVSFLLVGHTHDDIDASFGRWSKMLHENDYLTLPLLMQSYMELETLLVIPHMIEEVPDFKGFVKPFIASGLDSLVGHTRGQQFKFYVREDGWPVMQYKIKCHDKDWKPKGGIKLWKEDAQGKPMLPHGEPKPVPVMEMKHIEEILRGISGFVDHWESIADIDMTGEYGRRHEFLINYWTDVHIALQHHADQEASLAPLSLNYGFWPKTRVGTVVGSMYRDDGTVREEHDVDEPFIGWDTNKKLKWEVNSNEGLAWIDIDCIFTAWKSRNNKSDKVTVRVGYVAFVKDNLCRID